MESITESVSSLLPIITLVVGGIIAATGKMIIKKISSLFKKKKSLPQKNSVDQSSGNTVFKDCTFDINVTINLKK